MWIEIPAAFMVNPLLASPSTRRVWIEIFELSLLYSIVASPSTRRVWIEIPFIEKKLRSLKVTLHAEGVD